MEQTAAEKNMNRSTLAVVNQLPVPTYRFLKVNASSLLVPKAAQSAGDVWSVSALPDGVTLCPVAGIDALEERLSGIETGMGDSLDQALIRQGIAGACLTVAAGQQVQSPVIFPMTIPCSAASMTTLAIHACQGASVSVILDLGSDAETCAAARGFFGLSVRVLAEEGASVHVTQVLRMAQEMTWFGDLGGRCLDDAKIELTTLSLGGSKRTSDSEAFLGARVELTGEGASFISRTGYYCAGQTRLDMNYIADQRGRNTVSDMIFRGILTDHAAKTWRGTIDFKRGSAGSAGDEQEDTLMLSSHVENDSVPVILCGEEDVDGRHGATIGQLSEEMLFYMRARGYTDAQARRLVVQARLKSIARAIPDERIRWEVEQWIEREIA